MKYRGAPRSLIQDEDLLLESKGLPPVLDFSRYLADISEHLDDRTKRSDARSSRRARTDREKDTAMDCEKDTLKDCDTRTA